MRKAEKSVRVKAPVQAGAGSEESLLPKWLKQRVEYAASNPLPTRGEG